MKVLIVGGRQIRATNLTDVLKNNEQQVFFAHYGTETIEAIMLEAIDVVFIDLHSNSDQGIETVRLIRANSPDRWIYIEILTNPNAEQEIVSGLRAGADNYLSKTNNVFILEAKLKNYQRMASMQRHLIESNRELKRYHQQNEMESNLAKEVFDRLIHYELMRDEQISYWLLPSRTFSGDLIGAKRDGTGCLLFFLADATGHGLAAALPTMIVNQVFQALVEKDFDVSDIVREINQRLNIEIPVGHFVALAIGKINSQTNTVEIWNGGIPDLLLIGHQGNLLHRFPSRHVFAGVMKNVDFDGRTDCYKWQEDCELIAFSDGVIDALNEHGQSFGEAKLLQLLLDAPLNRKIESLKERLMKHIENAQEQDDVSCLAIRCISKMSQ